MEWYETNELNSLAKDHSLSSERRKLLSEFQAQLLEAIDKAYLSPQQFCDLTSQECSNEAEVAKCLQKIYQEVFG